jgi:hypothetical protein
MKWFLFTGWMRRSYEGQGLSLHPVENRSVNVCVNAVPELEGAAETVYAIGVA